MSECYLCGKPRDGRRWETYSNAPGDNRPVCPECVGAALDDLMSAIKEHARRNPDAWNEPIEGITP